jgi:hypothetical protein
MSLLEDACDFRATRRKLPRDAFAWGPDEPNGAPEDRIEEQAWASIVSLPDDVSLRTSNNHGSQLGAMHDLWSSWIESVGEDQDCMYYVMADAGDEYQACLFNALCGFYRVGASCLRSALELTLFGAYFRLLFEPDGVSEVRRWKEGKSAVSFEKALMALRDEPRAVPLEDHLCAQQYNSDLPWSVFGRKPPRRASSWARRLYLELSNFTHSRPNHSSGATWDGSNGPVFVRESFGTVYALYLDAMALCYVLVKLARPSLQLPRAARHLFAGSPALPSKVALYSCEFLWGNRDYSGRRARQA